MNGLQAPRRAGPAPRLVIETYREDGQVTLCVADNGIGIDEAHLAKIFDPFFTTKSEGMGMGLSICRSIVESHGGTLFARAGFEGGAAVRFPFPGLV